MLSGENDDLQVVQFWEHVEESSIQTSQDVFHQLQLEGYLVDYLRIPVTDEKAPKEIDFDLLIQRCWNRAPNTSLIFNCQMGRGRTTTGMIIAALLHLRQSPNFPSDLTNKVQKGTVEVYGGGGGFRQGYYAVVRSLMRVLERGSEAKLVLDRVIDDANHMQNMREAILEYRERLSIECNESKRNSILHVSLVSPFCSLINISDVTCVVGVLGEVLCFACIYRSHLASKIRPLVFRSCHFRTIHETKTRI